MALARVSLDGGQVTYGLFETEEEAYRGQGRWRLTHLLPCDDPDLKVDIPASVPVGGVRYDDWFERWQRAKDQRRSMVHVGAGAGPRRQLLGIGLSGLPGGRPRSAVEPSYRHWRRRRRRLALDGGGAPSAQNTMRIHFIMVRAFFNWLVTEGVLEASPITV